jgi:GT2 family glycosyltransferase
MLTIVTLNWNGSADTLACIASVERSRGPEVDMIVVDNGSAEADVARVADAVAARPWVSLVRNAENLGFAGGSNVGVALALERGARFVMLLNTDATVEPGAIAALATYVESRPQAGLVAPLILDESGERIWAAGGVRSRREVVCRLGLAKHPAADAPAAPFSTYALIGCAMVVRREVFERVGLLDEEYFAYVEDVDFSVRAREAGWTPEVVPAARVRHRVSRATGGGYTRLRSYLLGRGTALFIRRRAALDQRLGFALLAPVGLVAAAMREAPRGNLAAVAAKARGYVDGLLARPVSPRYFERR